MTRDVSFNPGLPGPYGDKQTDDDTDTGAAMPFRNNQEREKLTAQGPKWLETCLRTTTGAPLSNLANAIVGLREDPNLRDCFAMNEMSLCIVLCKPLPASNSGEGRQVRDTDITLVQNYLQRAGLRSVGMDTTRQAVDIRARECSFHPVRDYLDALEWDGEERAVKWLCTYLGADDTEYSNGVGVMFLISMVARIFQPGCQVDHMMCLEGEQGILKSTACRILAGNEWFSDSLPDIRSGKEASQHLRGVWVVEVSEMDAMNKTDTTRLKAFITRCEERYRPPYGRAEVTEPRQCVFFGTTNDDDYLKDATGGRRFWPIKCGAINITALKADRDQLLAEAVWRYKDGQHWWPDRNFERKHIAPEQAERYQEDGYGGAIVGLLDNRDEVYLADVARHLDIPTKDWHAALWRRLGTAMKSHSWTKGKRSNKGVKWFPPKKM